jgi:hypothetical protein
MVSYFKSVGKVPHPGGARESFLLGKCWKGASPRGAREKVPNLGRAWKCCEKVPHLETIRKFPHVRRADKGSSPGKDCVRSLTLEVMGSGLLTLVRLFSWKG